MVYSGKTKIEFCGRLGDSWLKLADLLKIPPPDQESFPPGQEARKIWEWLEAREKLQKLPAALRDSALKRPDLAELLEAGQEEADATPSWAGSPYRGLLPFWPAQAPIFFGRDQEISALRQRLLKPANRFLAVIGASGSGKSSLIAAGLIPRLATTTSGQPWLWVRLTPSEVSGDPFWSLATQLNGHHLHLMEQGYDARKIHDELKDPANIRPLIEKILSRQPPDVKLLIFIDQFEELFTQVDASLRKGFDSLLGMMAETAGLRTVLTLRADFYQHCLDLPCLTHLLQTEASAFPLRMPEREALAEMIRKPAAAAKLTFEDGLPRRILDDTSDEPGALPLMAFALDQLYNSCQPSTLLTHAVYDLFGGVKGAIGTWAEKIYVELNPDAQNAFDTVFRDLVDVDPERRLPTRKRALFSHFKTGPARKFIQQFTKKRLLVRDDPEQKGNKVVTVAHEALLTHWPRLAEWIEARFADFWGRKQLQHAAIEWEVQDRKDSYRWSHERVKEACDMLKGLDYRPTPLEQAFLGPTDPQGMLAEIQNPATSHERRALIGIRLAFLGDPRSGVGLREDGLPDIDWCKVPPGEVILEIERDQPTLPFPVVPFYIARYLVTWQQYQAFLEAADGYAHPEWWQGLLSQYPEPGRPFQPYDNHPADNVSWLDAVAFCRWLSACLGYEIRLPTEWEWQQAATAGDPANTYPWGKERNTVYANTYESGVGRSTAVGMYPLGASPVGALDMSGNLWEWCLNEFKHPMRTGLSGEAFHAVRGGSWGLFLTSARAAYRGHSRPDFRGIDLGFRVACSSPA